MSRKKGITTRVIHTPLAKQDAYGALTMPVYDNVAFEFESAQEIAQAFEGRILAHSYSRISNPTVAHFEERVKSVTGALAVVATASGMAAISSFFMSVAKAGDNIITSRNLFGNTFSLFEKTLGNWGLEVRYADLSDPGSVSKLIDENTRAIFTEILTNPQLEVVSLMELSEVCRGAGIPLVVDSTLTPLIFFDAREQGVDIELISSTKYISGGATSTGGLILDHGTYDWKKNPALAQEARKAGPFALVRRLRREVFRNLGPALAPHHARMQSLGLETLEMRIEKSSAGAKAVAEFLQKSGKVSGVRYPGLPGDPYYPQSHKLFSRLPGGLLTFDLPDRESCFKVIDNLKLFRRATNLNDNRSLVLHPWSTIYCEFSEQQRQEMGVRDTMIRLSVGIEDAQDLIDDLNQALSSD